MRWERKSTGLLLPHKEFVPPSTCSMFMATHLSGFGAGASAQNDFIGAINANALTSGLVLAIDAGDTDSYGGSGQTWSSVSPATIDVFLGATSGSDTDDPTFNGTAGDTDGTTTNFSYDGGDFHRASAAHPSTIDDIHQDGFQGTLLAIYNQDASNQAVFAGTAGPAAGDGFFWTTAGGDGTAQNFQVYEGLGDELNVSSTATVATGWNIVAISIDENGGAGASFFYTRNSGDSGTFDTFNGAYTAPSATGAIYTLEIMARGNANLPTGNGTRLVAFGIWSGTQLSQANVTALADDQAPRVGL